MVLNATAFLSPDVVPGGYRVSTVTYEEAPDRPRFLCVNVQLYKGDAGHSVHVGYLALHVSRAADLDALIAELSAARSWLDDAEKADQRCDNCNAVGSEENPLVPVESSAAHPEGYVHGAGCPDAGPHHEDAHADSAPHG